MAERVAVATLVNDPSWAALAAVTLPTHRAYADRCGAEFVVMDERHPDHPHYAKWAVRDLFARYDRVLFLDADAIVRRDTPDLFALVEPDRLAGENELLTWPDHGPQLQAWAARMGLPVPPRVPFYLNTGVFLAARRHAGLFRPPEVVDPGHGFPEQHHFNVRVLAERVPVQTLPEAFNDRHRRPGYLRGSFVLHYSVTAMDERVRRATADLAGWEEMFEREQVK